MVVDIFGLPSNYKEIKNSKKHKLKIMDSAHTRRHLLWKTLCNTWRYRWI